MTHTIYEVPLVLREERLDDLVVRRARHRSPRAADLADWEQIVATVTQPASTQVEIAVVGKYIEPAGRLQVASTSRSPTPASHNSARVKVRKIDAEEIETKGGRGGALAACDGILVPGGFGDRGIEGKIAGGRATRARTASPTSASASACRSR